VLGHGGGVASDGHEPARRSVEPVRKLRIRPPEERAHLDEERLGRVRWVQSMPEGGWRTVAAD
jgi:hypothetical protein